MTANEIIKILNLEPLSWEGGYFRQTYKSPTSTAIYYLITDDNFSALHRLKHDEIFHFYRGDPVTFMQLSSDHKVSFVKLGHHLENGELPQLIVPGGTWQGCQLVRGGKWALLGTTVSPGYEQKDFELGNREALQKEFPEHEIVIENFTR